MLEKLTAKERVVGVKQSRKAIAQGLAVQVFFASDADPELTTPLIQQCAASGVPVDCSLNMVQLGRACRITVGAAVVAVLK